MITYGTNPGMGIGISAHIPKVEDIEKASQNSFKKSLQYMGYQPDEPMIGKKVDYVFVGSCTNGRIEDLRAFAAFVKGKKKADNVTAWIVPGSKQVEKQAIEERSEEHTSELQSRPHLVCRLLLEKKKKKKKT